MEEPMIRIRVNVFQWWLTLVYFSIPGVAFAIAGYVRFTSGLFPEVDVDYYSYAALIVVVTVVWALAVEDSEINRVAALRRAPIGVKAIAKTTLIAMAVVVALTFFYRQTSFSRIFVASACLLMFLLTLLVFYALQRAAFSRKWYQSRVVIVGADDHAVRIANKLSGDPFVSCKVVCFVPFPGQAVSPGCGKVVGWDRLEEVTETLECHEVLVAEPTGDPLQLETVMDRVQQLCVPVRVVLNLGERFLVPERLFHFHGMALVDIGSYPVDSVRYVVFKRAFDVVLSIMALLLTAPMIVAIAVAIKLTSRGPVLFRQERLSLGGRRFVMLKFRTMATQEDGSSSTRHTARNDPRVTRLGRLLRRTSLDELPQFFNVLRGDMSVVGPRPELTFFVQQFRTEIPTYMSRHTVKCGITGWAQVNGYRGSDSSIPKRIEYDLFYQRNWSLVFDLKIILLTLWRNFIANENAY
jgi:Undecaprenyl-phosphate glucose phosphotransferase